MILYESVSEQLICGCGGTGRRAGLRNQCQRRGGSSPLIRTKRQNLVSIEKSIFYKVYFYKNNAVVMQ